MSGPVAPPSHFLAEQELSVCELIDRHLGGNPLSAEQLLDFGAVYLNRRRLSHDEAMVSGDLIRVHPNPRRFPGEKVDWRSRIVHEAEDFIIIDKPAGVPVHATCDNRRENVIAFLQRHFLRPLYICHRLDIGTEGLMAIAKTRDFCQQFNLWMANRQVHKRYRALVERPFELGERVHYMAPGDRAPHVVSEIPSEGWKECRLEVTQCQPQGAVFEVEITLGTGRHHQIRAQLSHMGVPILGDELYGACPRAATFVGEERVALQSFELQFPDGRCFDLAANWESHQITGG